MTSLIVYGVGFLLIVGAIFGVIHSHDSGIRSKQKAEDQVLLVACQTNEQTAKDANVTLQSSLTALGHERDQQSAEVLAWKGLADRAATVAADNLRANQGALAQLSAAQRDARAKAGRPATTMTCEQTLAEIDADSKEFATQRAILFPTSQAPAPSSLPGPKGQPAAPDAMRVK